MASTSPIAAALDLRADDMRVPSHVPAWRNPADGASSCLTYLMIWSDDCPTHFRGVSRPISLGAIRVGSSLDSRSDRPLISAGLEAGERVVGAGGPRRRVGAGAVRLAVPADVLM